MQEVSGSIPLCSTIPFSCKMSLLLSTTNPRRVCALSLIMKGLTSSYVVM